MGASNVHPPASTASQLSGVDRETIWRLARGSGQRVAVIDTGVQPHRRLNHVVAGGDYVSAGNGNQDCDGHGTMIAGIIAATPDPTDPTGFSGLAPDVTLISIRQSSTKFGAVSNSSGDGFGDVTTLAMAVRTAADMGASVINISAVACTESAPDDRTLGAALSYAVDVKDAVVVTAAGNVGGTGQCPMQNSAGEPTVIASPAWYDDYVIAVGSIGPNGTPSSFSLNGPWVDIAAPGEAVMSLDPAGTGVVSTIPGSAGPVEISGTSYAAPVVTAVAALLRSRFPRLSARQVMTRIEQTARKPTAGWDPAVGSGIVDVLAAVSDQTTTDAPKTQKPAAPPSTANPNTEPTHTVAVTGAALCLASVLAISLLPRLYRRRRPSTQDVLSN